MEIIVPMIPGDDIKTITDLLDLRAFRQPDSLSHIFLEDGEDEETCMTYADLRQKAKIIASRLLCTSSPGSRALLLYPPGLEYIAAFFGCMYAGIAAVPVYPPDPVRLNSSLRRLNAIINDSSPDIALTLSSVSKMASPLLSQPEIKNPIAIIETDSLQKEAGQKVPAVGVTEQSLAFLQYTSGSTALPKGVMVSHGNLLHNMKATANWYNVSGSSISGVSWLPPYHDMGLIGGVLQPVYMGAPVTLMSPLAFLQKPYRWLKAITKYRANITAGPNFSFDLCSRKITGEQAETLDLSSLEMVVNGAEPVRPDVLNRFYNKFKSCGLKQNVFSPAYGLAENTLLCTGVGKNETPVTTDYSENGVFVKQIVSCGKPANGQVVIIVDPKTGKKLNGGSSGEIWVSGPSTAKGYWNAPDKTAETFHAYTSDSGDGPFTKTGDIGFLKDGNLYVTGRLKDLIIIRGKNHAPQDIEHTAESVDARLRQGCNAAFSIDQGNTEKLILVQEIRKHNISKQDMYKILKMMRISIAEAHQVTAFDIVMIPAGTISKTSSGKIQRHDCKAQYLEGTLEIITDIGDAIKDTEETDAETIPLDTYQWLSSKVSNYTGVSADAISESGSLSILGFDSMTLAELNMDITNTYKININLNFLADPNTSLKAIANAINTLTDSDKMKVQDEKSLLDNLDNLSENELDYLLATT